MDNQFRTPWKTSAQAAEVRLYLLSLPGAPTAAIYMPDGMTVDGSDNLDAWANRVNPALYPLTSSEGTEPVAQSYPQFGNRLGMSCSGTQRMTSATLKALFERHGDSEPYSMYFACQFERDETAGDNDLAMICRNVAGKFRLYVSRIGTGPYTYTVTAYKSRTEGTALAAVASIPGNELQSQKLYICLCSQSSGGATLYVNDISNKTNQASWNTGTYSVADDMLFGSQGDGTRSHKGPISFMGFYPAEHTTAQIASMIEPGGWMPTYFNEQGDTILGMEPAYYCPVNDSTNAGGLISALPNQV